MEHNWCSDAAVVHSLLLTLGINFKFILLKVELSLSLTSVLDFIKPLSFNAPCTKEQHQASFDQLNVTKAVGFYRQMFSLYCPVTSCYGIT